MRKLTTGLALLALSATLAGCNRPATQRTTTSSSTTNTSTSVTMPGNAASGSRGNTDHRASATDHGNTDH